jgi:hypothetical protein
MTQEIKRQERELRKKCIVAWTGWFVTEHGYSYKNAKRAATDVIAFELTHARLYVLQRAAEVAS